MACSRPPTVSLLFFQPVIRAMLIPGQCLDVQLGSQPGTQIPFPSQGTLQTWQCFYDGNVNQAFHLLN